MRWRYWGDLTTKDFETLDPNRTIAVAPIAAHEQHGPHLPVSTDTILGEGMVREVVARLPDDLDVLFLPIMSVGKSNEHIRSPGTLTFSAQSALATWIELGESVHRAGLRKLIAVIGDSANAASIGTHRRAGFEHVGLIRSCGWKFDQWLDIVLMEKTLGASDQVPPESFRPGASI